jgi:hypothetical protein
VTNKDYEKLQVDAIELEYTSRGYTVRREPRLPRLKFIPDLIAERTDPREFVVIELLNRRGDPRHAIERMQVMSEHVAAAYPWAVFDFRYLDDPDGVAALPRIAATRSLLPPEEDVRKKPGEHLLRSLLKRRMPALPVDLDEYLGTQILVRDWVALTTLVRAFFVTFGGDAVANGSDAGQGDQDILDIYNVLLRRFKFKAADEQPRQAATDKLASDFHFLDLFEIRTCVGVAIEGGMVRPDVARQLRVHLISLKDQIRHRLG